MMQNSDPTGSWARASSRAFATARRPMQERANAARRVPDTRSSEPAMRCAPVRVRRQLLSSRAAFAAYAYAMPGIMPLHEAIEKVLTDADRPMHVSEIADEVTRRGLYERGDGGPIPTNQIHARIAKPRNRDRFTVSDGMVRLA